MTMTTLLGIDAGTTSMKAVLFDLDGHPLGMALREYKLITPTPDRVELDAETYWDACCHAVREAVATSGTDHQEIAALAISSQGETTIPLDQEGKPLRRAIVWLDNRATAEAAWIEREFGVERVFQTTGQPEIVPTWPASKILWIREHEPEIFQRAAKFLLVEDYLLYKLTGRFVADKSLYTSSIMVDIEHKCWWDDMLHFLGLTPERLGDLLEPGEVVGPLSEEGTAASGLSTQTIAVTCSMDQMAGALGAGNVRPGLVTETTGGALALCVTLPGFVLDPQRRITTQYHALRDTYCLLPYGQTGGMALRWFRDALCQTEMIVAPIMGMDCYDLLTQEAAQVPPGCDGLVFLPHLMGAASPEFDPAARGVFYGIALKHHKPHFARAILESVAYMLKKNLDLVERISGKVDEVRSMGGGARSKLWLSIKADVLQKAVTPVVVEESASLGAAIMAGVATGVFQDLEEGLRRMVRLGERINPNPANARAYQVGYQEYLDLYDSLAPMFKRSQARRAAGQGDF
jgi:sugar (pentulose or hexulose) kinase